MMKKIILLFVAAFISLTVLAQEEIIVKPMYQVNDTAIYHNNGVCTMSALVMGMSLNSSMDMRLVVKEKTSGGYVVELYTDNVKVETDNSNPMADILGLSIKMVEGCKMLLALTPEGKLERIVNYDEVKKTQMKTIEKLIDKFYTDFPSAAAVLPKETIISQTEAQSTEEAQLLSLLSTANLFAFNGLTLKEGARSEYQNPTGLTMNRVVTKLDGKERMAETKAECMATGDEMKQMVIQRAKENMPDAGEDIVSQIVSMIDSGMLKVNFEESANVSFFPNLYVKSIDVHNTSDVMGQKSDVRTTLTCTYRNF